MEGKSKAETSRETIVNALVVAGKRAALAERVKISDGQLSKLLNGELDTYCRILEALGLEVVRTRYLESIEQIAAEHLPRFSRQ